MLPAAVKASRVLRALTTFKLLLYQGLGETRTLDFIGFASPLVSDKPKRKLLFTIRKAGFEKVVHRSLEVRVNIYRSSIIVGTGVRGWAALRMVLGSTSDEKNRSPFLISGRISFGFFYNRLKFLGQCSRIFPQFFVEANNLRKGEILWCHSIRTSSSSCGPPAEEKVGVGWDGRFVPPPPFLALPPVLRACFLLCVTRNIFLPE